MVSYRWIETILLSGIIVEILHVKLLNKPIPIDNAVENNLGYFLGK